MEKLVEIKLSNMQEIQDINIQPADNGGCVLSYSIYKPAMKNSDSEYKRHTEVFSAEELELALDRIRNLYKANLEMKVKGSAEVPVAAPKSS
jgi:hypothetical protein